MVLFRRWLVFLLLLVLLGNSRQFLVVDVVLVMLHLRLLDMRCSVLGNDRGQVSIQILNGITLYRVCLVDPVRWRWWVEWGVKGQHAPI